jgi:hypothetical protein
MPAGTPDQKGAAAEIRGRGVRPRSARSAYGVRVATNAAGYGASARSGMGQLSLNC